MARAYQESHILDSLSTTAKTLQTKVVELAKLSGLHEERIQKLTTANTELISKNAALEIRIAANEHNTHARLSNLYTTLSPSPSTIHKPLLPLHDLSTNRPIRHFPKHERDIRTMSPAEVIQVLQALGVKTLGMGMAERKRRLREEVGLRGEVEKGEGS
ncbi:hypothetical protein JMJ35_003987 [Cladonia borealis]|uniref:Uncharacterized protein n=1 Tax=Cladonia borealis TaxID=184061 RepID=A0AA39R5C8_9LECA|nr:hypothetical protein JMJ35_003987 [Cladonia borealis]